MLDKIKTQEIGKSEDTKFSIGTHCISINSKALAKRSSYLTSVDPIEVL